MKMKVSYHELTELIHAKANYKIDFSFVDADTIRVSKEIKIPIIGTKSIRMDVTVIDIEGNDLKLKAASNIISSIISMITELDVSKYVHISGDTIVVHLDNIEQIKNGFEYMTLKSIGFTTDSIETDAILKI